MIELSQRAKRFLASGLSTYLSILFALVLAVHTSTISYAVGILLGLLLLVATGVAEYVLTYGPLLQYRDRQLSTFFGDYLRLVEEDMEAIAASDVSVRANVMRPSRSGFRDDPTLSIAYYHEEAEYDPEEFQLEFEVGQGCVGRAYETGDQKFAISPEHVRSWDDAWSTTKRQNRVTAELNTIIGTPIYRPDSDGRGEPVAILIVDSEDHIDEFVRLDENQELAGVDPKDTIVGERALEHARNAGILL